MATKDQIIARMNQLEQRATELVNLAGTYLDDGAPATAADRLRLAASTLDELAETKATLFERVPA